MKKWALILILVVWPLYLMNVTLTKNDTVLDNLGLQLDSIVNKQQVQQRQIEENWDGIIDHINGVEGELQGCFEALRERIIDTPTIEDTVPKVIPGVVHVMCPEWQGSGFVVGPRLIATARHVVEGVTDFTITTYNGHKLRATRAISFKNRDVGFIWIDDLRCVSEVERELECSKVKHEVTLQVLELGSIKECNLGQSVFAIGSPYGKVNFNHLSSGIVSSLNPEWEEKGGEYGWEVGWTTTTVGHPGNSGCPIFSLDGKVRGVLVGGFSPVLIIAMPVDLFKDRLAEVTLIFGMDQFRKEEPIPQVAEDWSYTSKGDQDNAGN